MEDKMKGVFKMVGKWNRATCNCKWLRDDSDRAGSFEYCKKAKRKVVCWGDKAMCEHPKYYEEMEVQNEKGINSNF